VAHEFLLHLHRSPGFIKQGPESVPERVPADPSDTIASISYFPALQVFMENARGQ
jgi:hypothetical protein